MTLRELESEEIRLNAELSSLHSLVAQLTAQTENSGRQIAESEEKILSAKQAECDAEKSAAEVGMQINELEKHLAEYQKNRENLRLERAELSQKISLMKVRDAEISKDIQSQEAEISRIESDLEILSCGNKYLEEEITMQ